MTLNKQRLLDEIEWVEKQDKIAEELGYSEWFQEDWMATPEEHAQSLAYYQAVDRMPSEGPLQVSLYREALLADGCGTAYCLAGHVTATDNPEWSQDMVSLGARVYAQGALGLTYSEAYELFHGLNDATDMRRIAEWIIARHEEES